MKDKNKKDYLEAFKEMYSRNPTQEELKAFIDCMCLKKEQKYLPTTVKNMNKIIKCDCGGVFLFCSANTLTGDIHYMCNRCGKPPNVPRTYYR
jgi:hypothetical protein